MNYYSKLDSVYRKMEFLENRMLLAGEDLDKHQQVGLPDAGHEKCYLGDYMRCIDEYEDEEVDSEQVKQQATLQPEDIDKVIRVETLFEAAEKKTWKDVVEIYLGNRNWEVMVKPFFYTFWKIATLKAIIETARDDVVKVAKGVEVKGKTYPFLPYAQYSAIGYIFSRFYQEPRLIVGEYQHENETFSEFILKEMYELTKEVSSEYVASYTTSFASELTPLTDIMDKSDPAYRGYSHLGSEALIGYLGANILKCTFSQARVWVTGASDDHTDAWQIIINTVIFSGFFALSKFSENRALQHAGSMDGKGNNREVYFNCAFFTYTSLYFLASKAQSLYEESFRSEPPHHWNILWKKDTENAKHDALVNLLQYALEFGLTLLTSFVYKRGVYHSISANPDRGKNGIHIIQSLWDISLLEKMASAIPFMLATQVTTSDVRKDLHKLVNRMEEAGDWLSSAFTVIVSSTDEHEEL